MSPEDVAAAVAGIRERVRERHAKTDPRIADFALPSLEPLAHARDRAGGKAAAIGTVNPRPPGLLNDIAQRSKRLVARALGWFVRDQVEFNRAAVAAMDRTIETLTEQNHNLLRVAREFSDFRDSVAPRMDAHAVRLDELARDGADVLRNLNEWRPALEERLTRQEIASLHAFRELEATARTREDTFRAEWLKLHHDYAKLLDQAIGEVQERLWADLARLKDEHERQIHAELRVLRRQSPSPTVVFPQAPVGATEPAGIPLFDYARFEERFRGDESFVSASLEFYLTYLEGAGRVLDLGCGRGELLKLLADRGVEARGVDLDSAGLAACREKGLDVVEGDLFEFLAAQPPESCGGIVCAHVVEHLPWRRVPELIASAHRALRPGGVLAFETPNPACLAIFAGDFYLDPTHQKPVPSAQLDFHLTEAGYGRIEVHERHPAAEVFPELARLDEVEALRGFRRRFFGGLDYAIIGRKLGLS